MLELMYDISPSAEDHQAHQPEKAFLEVHNKNIGPDTQQWLHASTQSGYTVVINHKAKTESACIWSIYI